MQEYALQHPLLTFLGFWIAVWGVVVIANAIRLTIRPTKKKKE